MTASKGTGSKIAYIYAVGLGYRRADSTGARARTPELHRYEVKVRDKTVRYANGWGMEGYGYRHVVPIAEVAWTPADAVERWLARLDYELARTRDEVERLEQLRLMPIEGFEP